MTWYLLNISFLFIMGLSDCFECRVLPEDANRNRKMLFFSETLIWILLSGLRRLDIGEDTSTYAYMFEREMTLPWSSVWDDFIKKYILQLSGVVDPGYKVFEKVVHYFTKDYQLYLVIVAVVFFVSLALFLYKNSYIPVLSYTLFCSMFFGWMFVLHNSSESQLEAIKTIRAWAAPRISSDQIIAVTDNKEKNNDQ